MSPFQATTLLLELTAWATVGSSLLSGNADGMREPAETNKASGVGCRKGIDRRLDCRQGWTAILALARFEKDHRALVHAAAAIAVECLHECILAL